MTISNNCLNQKIRHNSRTFTLRGARLEACPSFTLRGARLEACPFLCCRTIFSRRMSKWHLVRQRRQASDTNLFGWRRHRFFLEHLNEKYTPVAFSLQPWYGARLLHVRCFVDVWRRTRSEVETTRPVEGEGRGGGCSKVRVQFW